MKKEESSFIKISIILVLTGLVLLAILYLMQKSTYPDNDFAEVNQVILNNEEKSEEPAEERHEFTAYGHTFSYEGDGEIAVGIADKFLSREWAEDKLAYFEEKNIDQTYVSYNDDLYMSRNLYWPYAIYKEFDASKIKYECDGTFLKTSDSAHDDLRWQYCETNGVDYLKQFEYGSIYGVYPNVSGGGFFQDWNVIYAKNIDGTNYFFSTELDVVGALGDGHYTRWHADNYPEVTQYCVDDYTCYDFVSKEFLGLLLADEENQKILAEADKFVQSLELVK